MMLPCAPLMLQSKVCVCEVATGGPTRCVQGGSSQRVYPSGPLTGRSEQWLLQHRNVRFLCETFPLRCYKSALLRLQKRCMLCESTAV